MASTEIPNRAAFKAAEVCAIAELQPYVLRTWEAEFPDLGIVKAGQDARVYRKVDVERVLRLKHLILVEGLTLAGARRKITEAEGTAEESDAESLLPSLLSAEVKKRILEIRNGLASLLTMLSSEPRRAARAEKIGSGRDAADFALHAPAGAAPSPKAARKRKK